VSERLPSTKLALIGRRSWHEQGALRTAEPVAVIGLGCRFPGGVTDPDSLWELLAAGRDAVTEVPPDRWDLGEWYDADPATPGTLSTRWGGFLDDVKGFDAAFFDISPAEADRMDPQQRVALEVACEAIEHSGIPLTALRGTDTGVYFASYHSDYALLQYGDVESINARTLTGTLHSVLANRISYSLGLHGPSLAVDSACSSSLVAVHLACQALRTRD
jgi:acyl transferase domain-containing protein